MDNTDEWQDQWDRARKRYGFVRFWNEEHARKSIQVLNNTMVRRARIRVCLAKYGKGSFGSSVKKDLKQSGGMVDEKEGKQSVGTKGISNQSS